MLIKDLHIQRKSTYDSNPGTIYGTITITGRGGIQELNLSGKAMVAILQAVQSEVIQTAKHIAKDATVAFQNTTGELELIEHPLAQIEET